MKTKKLFFIMLFTLIIFGIASCGGDEPVSNSPQDENIDNTKVDDNKNEDKTKDDNSLSEGKILIVYYSFTNNIHTIVTDLMKQINADIIRIEPKEKGLDYAANNYAIGSSLISAIRRNPNDISSYPAIDPVKVELKDYNTIIVATPLWWSNMAAPLQTFLFKYGKDMAGKNILLIVSSASSAISEVERDAKRMISEGHFQNKSLWIRSSQVSNCHTITNEWLKSIGLR